MALNLTPCVYPLIPITLSFFVGQAQQRWERTAILAACYALGLAITYSTLGLIASLTGEILGAALQQPWVPLLIALVMVALGLSLCGFFEFRIPGVLISRLGIARTGAIGALLMGLTVGIIAAPCIGPFVLRMLLYVGHLGRSLVGFWLFRGSVHRALPGRRRAHAARLRCAGQSAPRPHPRRLRRLEGVA